MSGGKRPPPRSPHFVPQLSRNEAIAFAARYDERGDADAFVAGAKILGGDYSPGNLLRIFEWKTTGRGRSRLLRNEEPDIHDALRLACMAETPRAAIAVLTSLDGIAVPVASAIMTTIYPDRFTVIDFRALEALGSKSADRSVRFYVLYLDYCRQLAEAWAMSLRQLDRALWQWSKDR